MKPILYIIILLIGCITVQALEINVTEKTLNLTVDELYQDCIRVTNTNNATYYNISMTNFLHNKINSLNIGQSNNLCYNITRTQTGDVTFNPIVYGFYKINYTAERQTHTINLIDLSNHTIRELDTVQFCNNYAVPHTIQEYSGAWQHTLNASQCINVSTIHYTQEVIDLTNMQIGFFDVESNIIEQYARDNDIDEQFTLNLHVSFPKSALYINPLVRHYTVPYNEEVVGILQVVNDNIAVDGVKLSIDRWGEFENSTINLESNESRFIYFNIKPKITMNSETGKSYTLTLNAEVPNFKNSTATITVYIPEHNITQDNQSQTNKTKIIVRAPTEDEIEAYLESEEGQDLIEWYCFEKNGTNEKCIRYKEKYLNIDMNESMNKRFDLLERKVDSTKNELTDMRNNDIKNLDNNVKRGIEISENSTQMQEQNYKPIADSAKTQLAEKKTFSWVVLIIIIVVVGSLGLGFFIYHNKKKVMRMMHR